MKVAFLFPGQGSQYVGMGKDFVENFPIARNTLQEAEELLGRKLSTTIFEGPDTLLTETRNSQVSIYVISVALLNVLKQLFPQLTPHYCAGLSLGEYTALHAAGKIGFSECLDVVQQRGQYMNDACLTHPGTMAVILGLEGDMVEKIVKEVNLPNDLWAANFNCPGQVVISGTIKGIAAGTEALLAKGAKRVLPLPVHGAFHSGLMKSAEERLAPAIQNLSLITTDKELIMNVVGGPVKEIAQIKSNLIKQVSSPVRWEQGIKYMISNGATLFLEIGCGKALQGFNKRIGAIAPSFSLEKITDLEMIEKCLKGEL